MIKNTGHWNGVMTRLHMHIFFVGEQDACKGEELMRSQKLAEQGAPV